MLNLNFLPFRCFLLLLLLAAVLWKIKQKYDLYRRRQRLFVEMEQMASRPFSEVSLTRVHLLDIVFTWQNSYSPLQVLVDIENRGMEAESPTPVIESLTKAQKKRKKVNVILPVPPIDETLNSILSQDAPSPIALEPCNGNRAAVLSLLVRLPSGNISIHIKSFAHFDVTTTPFYCRCPKLLNVWPIGWFGHRKCSGHAW